MVIYDNSTNILIIPDGTVGPDIEDRFEDKTVEITENGDYLITPDEGYDALSSVELSVNVSCDDAYNSGYTDGYESGRTDGYTEGYDSGRTDGYAEGYESGRTDGYTDGYNAGYSAGYEAGSEACGRDYLTVHNTSSQPTTVDITPSSVLEGTFEYRKTGGVWTTISGYTRVTLENGEKVEFRGDNPQYSEDYSNNTNIRVFGGSAEVYGNVMSLIADAAEFPSGSDYNFCGLFQNSYALTDASNLSLPSGLTQGCYQNMFKGCNTLTGTPELNATQIVQSCYEGMFEGCSSLTTAPDMPGQNLAKYGYKRMFANCGSLRNNIPASLPGDLAYYGSCYEMFLNCTSLTTAPALPATEIHGSAYMFMFRGCTSLTTAPELPATLLTSGPDDIGEDTTGITQYSGMFWDCTGLTTAPSILPATGTLPGSCYSHMFQNCTSLTTAPILPAEDQEAFAYGEMFRGCSNLNYVKCLSQNTNNTRDWLNGVAETGTFVKDANTTWQRGPSAIPVGWWVEDDNPVYSAMPLTFEILSAGTISASTEKNLEYSLNDGEWTTYASGLNLQQGDVLKLRGNNETSPSFGGTAYFNAYGNAYSVLSATGFENITALTVSQTCSYMFGSYEYEDDSKGANIVSAENLKLPATTLANSCYSSMFRGCTSLTSAPELPATRLADRCYYMMFQNCTSLTTAPELPATILANSCYMQMFLNCTSLVAAPSILPATRLIDSCYRIMFYGCTSLTTAPKLPATSLATNCYSEMFENCTSLTTAPALPATTLERYCYRGMFKGCTSLTTAPSRLPATRLASYCYQEMFKGCRSLNYIKCLATIMSATDCTKDWVQSVASSGTFVKAADVEWSRGTSGIPTGWTVIDAE